MAEQPQSIGRRYLVARLLGTGGMASVFLCWDQRLEVWCAVKVMAEWLGARPEARQQFAAEARTMARVAHPHVLRIFDVVDDVATPYLVTEYVDGGSLQDLDPIHPAHAAQVCAQVARALQAAHDAQVVHRDVKPANILLDRAGVPRLGDFGIAVLGAGRGGAAPAGTLGFMPPEQRAGQPTARSDLYALGAVLFAVVARAEPEVLRKAGRDEALDRLPEALRPIVRRATLRDPTERYESAAELADALQSVVPRMTSRELGPLRPEARPPPTRPPDRPMAPELAGLLSGTTGAREADDQNTNEVPPPVGKDGVRLRLVDEPDLKRTVHRLEVPRRLAETLLRAGRTLDGLGGYGVPEVLATGRTADGGQWLTVSQPTGESLAQVAAGAIPTRRALRRLALVRQVCARVARAHEAGVAHGGLRRDVILANGDHVAVGGWGGPLGLLALAEPATAEARRADARALGELLRWCQEERVVDQRAAEVAALAASDAFPDARAVELALRTAPSPSGRPVRLVLVAVAIFLALGGAVLAAAAVAVWEARSPEAPPAPATPEAVGSLQAAVDTWWRSGARQVPAPTSGSELDPEILRRWTQRPGQGPVLLGRGGGYAYGIGDATYLCAAVGGCDLVNGQLVGGSDGGEVLVTIAGRLHRRALRDVGEPLRWSDGWGQPRTGSIHRDRWAAASDRLLVVGDAQGSGVRATLPGPPDHVALSDTDVIVALHERVLVYSLTAPTVLTLRSGAEMLVVHDDGLLDLLTSWSRERWQLGPPWHLRACGAPVVALTALGSGRVVVRAPDGTTDLVERGVRTRCDPSSLGECAPAPPAARVGNVRPTVEEGQLAFRSDAGLLLARLGFDRPVVAVGAVPDALFVALDDGRVLEIEPGLFDVLAGKVPTMAQPEPE